MNFKALSHNLGLDENEYKELIKLFVETSLCDLDSFLLALQEKNNERAAGSVHSIKGAASNLGLVEVYQLVREIERDVENHRIQNCLKSTLILKDKLDAIEAYLKGKETVI